MILTTRDVDEIGAEVIDLLRDEIASRVPHATVEEAIHETLPAWLTRRHAQPELHVLTPREG